MDFCSRAKRKSPIHREGLFEAFEAFSESQFHAREELDARNGIIVVQLVLLAGHVIQQREGRDLIVHLVVRAEAEVENIFHLLA